MAKRGLGEMKITQKTQNKEASRNGKRWGSKGGGYRR
jgi:hypothetical protein